ncbi:MAG: helix-turn-helix transcriptional regulator [Campylobacterota bacterium]|nr:helix-turn-helix transcriptional regulator [Campylobacterota bacterium]
MTPQEFLLFTEEEIAEDLGERASKLRIRLNMTQKEFATKAGISFATYRKFEQTGQTSIVTFLKILRYLGVLKDISDLMSMDDVQNYGINEYMKLSSIKERKRVKSSST